MNNETLIQNINHAMELALPPGLSLHELRLRLQKEINELIANNFNQLVSILYRVDVNERKLKFLLQENVGEDAAVIIADLLIERQLEKIKARAAFKQDNAQPDDEEKW
ncbi:MAG TPA: hypothetical protein VL307_07175 [Chitinophagaceae bacterium]|nr:hypothetical protein [Chitinophagaceae bacterium]